MKLRRWAPVIFVMLFAIIAGAEEVTHEAHAEEGGIPRAVFYQTVNFIIFAAILIWLLRKKVIDFFNQRRDEYLAAVRKFEHAKAEAERKATELRVRLEHLESSAIHSVEKAKQEAGDIQSKIVADAQGASQKLQAEAKKTVEVEVARAIQDLREEVLKQATEAARQIMQQQLKEQDQKRLQNEFVEKIQEVRQ